VAHEARRPVELPDGVGEHPDPRTGQRPARGRRDQCVVFVGVVLPRDQDLGRLLQRQHLGDGFGESVLVADELGVDESEHGDIALGQSEHLARGSQLCAAQSGHLGRIAGWGLAPVRGNHQMNGGAGVDLTHDGRPDTERLIVGMGSHHHTRPAGRRVGDVGSGSYQCSAHHHLQHRVQRCERVLDERTHRRAEHGARHYRVHPDTRGVSRMSRPKNK